MTNAELVGDDAHVYVMGKAGHRPDHLCPCRPATPLTSAHPDTVPENAGLYVHRPHARSGATPWR